MTLVENFLPALWVVLSPTNMVIMTIGVVIGILLGALPGFGASQALALTFPFTFGMEPVSGVLFFIAIYAAAEYGGAIPSILIRTPGNAAAAITILDGFPMAQKGLAGRALKISLYTGVFGSMMSSFVFLFGASGLAWVGLQFGPTEMLAVGIFGLAIIGSFFGDSPVRGFIATGIGLFLATIGSSGFSGTRFAFGQAALLDGLPLIVVITGLLAVPEAFNLMAARRGDDMKLAKHLDQSAAGNRVGWKDMRALMPTMWRGTLIGTAVGAVPGAGATVASLLAYNEEKRWSKHPEKFGTGVDEGVAAPETANNAIVAGALIPSLALGIPGSGAIAILLGLLISRGIVPGPLLFSQGGDLVMSVFVGLIVSALLMLVVGIAGIHAFVQVARVPRYILAPFVLITLMIGTYAYQNYATHVVLTLVIGAVAYWFEKIRIPVIPIVLAFVMGPIIEANLNRAMVIHGGDLSFVLQRPIALVILVLAVVTAVFSFLRGRPRIVRQAEA
ncbi:tripartite tricarboxylate transporter permease [Antarcticirhabdus aurantiaca]|uniref:Tripartite tricarboxylate transporter permease n=1 Tax=Antarcticirhabdus aurantiaca TaxID=2606717 RepID=A0ACD4NMV6_9HYPH|nr:tripartite tricarboxylate transporter permease [Antarcticirhabdus aurantiaca]WAJ28194.1 tripartite tricarboxylate transporter permease [Jeongeuplla avenae]